MALHVTPHLAIYQRRALRISEPPRSNLKGIRQVMSGSSVTNWHNCDKLFYCDIRSIDINRCQSQVVSKMEWLLHCSSIAMTLCETQANGPFGAEQFPTETVQTLVNRKLFSGVKDHNKCNFQCPIMSISMVSWEFSLRKWTALPKTCNMESISPVNAVSSRASTKALSLKKRLIQVTTWLCCPLTSVG